MKFLRSIIIFTFTITLPLNSFTQVTNPNVYINEYNKLVSGIGETAKTYDYVMAIYNEYSPVLNNNNSSYSDKQIAVSGLKWLFPYLMNGAFYYSEHNNQMKALSFAEAYIDTYVNPAMKTAELSVNELYPTLAFFAASNNYNQKTMIRL